MKQLALFVLIVVSSFFLTSCELQENGLDFPPLFLAAETNGTTTDDNGNGLNEEGKLGILAAGITVVGGVAIACILCHPKVQATLDSMDEARCSSNREEEEEEEEVVEGINACTSGSSTDFYQSVLKARKEEEEEDDVEAGKSTKKRKQKRNSRDAFIKIPESWSTSGGLLPPTSSVHSSANSSFRTATDPLNSPVAAVEDFSFHEHVSSSQYQPSSSDYNEPHVDREGKFTYKEELNIDWKTEVGGGRGRGGRGRRRGEEEELALFEDDEESYDPQLPVVTDKFLFAPHELPLFFGSQRREEEEEEESLVLYEGKGVLLGGEIPSPSSSSSLSSSSQLTPTASLTDRPSSSPLLTLSSPSSLSSSSSSPSSFPHGLTKRNSLDGTIPKDSFRIRKHQVLARKSKEEEEEEEEGEFRQRLYDDLENTQDDEEEETRGKGWEDRPGQTRQSRLTSGESFETDTSFGTSEGSEVSSSMDVEGAGEVWEERVKDKRRVVRFAKTCQVKVYEEKGNT